MNLPQFTPALLAVLALGVNATQPALAQSFAKKHLNTDFWAEGAAIGDFNKDGIPDVAYGPFWYEGPDFKRERAFAPTTATWQLTKPDGAVETKPGFMGAKSPKNGYSDNFLAFSEDLNKDGWEDILVIGFPGKEAFWYENPRGAETPWTRHLALPSVDNESPGWLTVTKDGRKGLVCSTGGVLGFGLPVEGKPAEPWVWHPISPKGPWQKFTHGLGMGDINGDGRPDLLEARGWWEQPPSLEGNPEWVFHETLFGRGGAQMLVTDVNGDGLPDVITSIQAHGYGIAWFEQTRENGGTGWNQHPIVGEKPEQTPHGTVFSQPHALALADINGDGLPDLVCGKRFWAHGPSGDPEPNAPAVLYWFELKRDGKTADFIPHLIDHDSGVGTQVTVAPLGPARKLGIVVGNKKGLFTFER